MVALQGTVCLICFLGILEGVAAEDKASAMAETSVEHASSAITLAQNVIEAMGRDAAYKLAAFCCQQLLDKFVLIISAVFYTCLVAALEFPLAVVVLSNAMAFLIGISCCKATPKGHALPQPHQHLHWDLQIQRRGIGDLLTSVNHVALIVSDVGRSLAFYTEIIGFQQIQRPNFDRHGAWLTMGNLELHLIKGVPNAPSGKDLIVSHIALDTQHPELVLEKLTALEVPFRQNISVPDPAKARENLVECFDTSDGKVTQFFIRDPDGYYWELCNCDILTKFCMFQEGDADNQPEKPSMLSWPFGVCNESGQPPSHFRCPQVFKLSVVIKRLLKEVRKKMQEDISQRVARKLSSVDRASEPDKTILQNFMNRTKTYCDITQGFKETDFVEALCAAGNNAPLAILFLMEKRVEESVYLPPQYLLSEGGKIRQQVFKIPRQLSSLQDLGTANMYRPKAFIDNVQD